MAAKYYTHFVTDADQTQHPSEWSGVVELTRPLTESKKATAELAHLLAESFNLDSEEIRVLQWARLH